MIAAELKLPGSDTTLTYKGGEFDLAITANCEWTLSIDATWAYLIAPRSRYEGDAVLTVVVERSAAAGERSTTLLFSYGEGKERSFQIRQEAFPAYLDVSEEEVLFGPQTAEKVIMITSNCGWTAASSASWLHIRPSTGLVGQFEMTLTVEAAESQEQRTANVTVENQEYGLSHSVLVVQTGRQDPVTDRYIDENGVDHGVGIRAGDRVWAPVNCGFKADLFPYGKLFQWGRKNGLGYRSASIQEGDPYSVAPTWEGKNGEESSQAFYLPGSASRFAFDWILSGDDAFWNVGTEENPLRSASHDPCPDGWRVPTSYELRTLLETEGHWTEDGGRKGWLFGEALFFPAGGRIDMTAGDCLDRDVEGYYWTNTAEEGRSVYLYFQKEGVSINRQGVRAGACAVRCVRE